ncbi:hypothetical protein [Demequina subtropica]|uniref:hypothetical protein n=1 Tax=Demequina subtropica TaxID=1638989 RepID=UPI000782A851|nr:hypothetical protein [Demequina subtropica]
MGASAKLATTHALVAACDYWIAKGGRVTEMQPYGEVHKGHSSTSFHYDTDGVYGQAADLNVGTAGAPASERALMVACRRVFESLGLSVLYDYTGNGVAVARAHRDHGHIDVGSYSNFGDGPVKHGRGSTAVVDTQVALHQPPAMRDNLLGDTTAGDLAAVRDASVFGGEKFDAGLERAQRAVGVATGGDWDAKSRAAHDATVAALQRVWHDAGLYKGRVDSVWGPGTDAAYDSLLSRFKL